MTYPLLVATGRIKDTLTLALISLPITGGLVLAASFFGIDAVAAAMFVTAPAQTLAALWLIKRHTPFGWMELADAIRPSAIMTLFASIVPLACLSIAGSDPSQAVVALAALGAVAGWSIGLRMTHHPLLPLASQAFRAVAARLPVRPLRRAAP